MYRNVGKICPFTYGFLGFEWKTVTDDRVFMNKEEMEQYQRWKLEEHPIDRLKQMYSLDEYGNISPEFSSIKQSSFIGLLFGALIGGTIESKIAYMNFMERNQATAFENHFDAKKTLQDNVTKGFARGAFRWSWRLCLFTTSFSAVSTTISAYRGKSTVLEYIAAGGFTGLLYKANMGLKGMAAGLIFGSGLGLIAGLPIIGLLKLTGLSMEEIRYWQYSWRLNRSKIKQEAIANDLHLAPTALEADHELRVGTDKLSLDKIDQTIKKLENVQINTEESRKTQTSANK